MSSRKIPTTTINYSLPVAERYVLPSFCQATLLFSKLIFLRFSCYTFFFPAVSPGQGYFDLVIKDYPGGNVSSYMHGLKEGDLVEVKPNSPVSRFWFVYLYCFCQTLEHHPNLHLQFVGATDLAQRRSCGTHKY